MLCLEIQNLLILSARSEKMPQWRWPVTIFAALFMITVSLVIQLIFFPHSNYVIEWPEMCGAQSFLTVKLTMSFSLKQCISLYEALL